MALRSLRSLAPTSAGKRRATSPHSPLDDLRAVAAPLRSSANERNPSRLTAADQFLKAWMPLVTDSPAYKHGSMLVVVTFDEAEVDATNAEAACCGERPGPNTVAIGGGQIGALFLSSRHISPGSIDIMGAHNHSSALRSYEDLLGLTTSGADGEGHLGFAAATSLVPFGADVFNAHAR